MTQPTPTVQDILDRIAGRLIVLGNKTRGNKSTADEKLRAAHGARELAKIQEWILNGGKNKPS